MYEDLDQHRRCFHCCALSGGTASALAWHTQRRVFAPRLLQQVLVICSPYLHLAIRGAQEVLPCVEWGVTASQLDLPSLTPLFLAGCGRLQLGAPHWAISVALLQVVDN